MTLKPHALTALAAAIIIVILAEWKFVASMTRTEVMHGYHGLCNGGVGEPYADFVHQLRALCESGDTNALARALRRADERSRDIYDVWLADKRNAYRESIQDILK